MELKFSKIIDRLEAVLSKFADDNTEEVSTEENEQSFAEVALMDGTMISYEGELAAGTAIFVVTEEGDNVPAPEGTYALGGDFEGVSLIVDADGVITEVVDERTTEEPTETEEEMSKEETPTGVTAEQVDEKLSEAIGQLPLEKIAEGLEALLEENESLKAYIAELKGEFNAFKETPDAKEENEKKFARTEMTAAEIRENRMRNNFNKK